MWENFTHNIYNCHHVVQLTLRSDITIYEYQIKSMSICTIYWIWLRDLRLMECVFISSVYLSHFWSMIKFILNYIIKKYLKILIIKSCSGKQRHRSDDTELRTMKYGTI